MCSKPMLGTIKYNIVIDEAPSDTHIIMMSFSNIDRNDISETFGLVPRDEPRDERRDEHRDVVCISRTFLSVDKITRQS